MASDPGFTRRDFLRGAVVLASLGFASPTFGAEPSAVLPGKPIATQPIYPDDAFSRSTVDRLPAFATLAGCTLEGNVLDRTSRFSQFELRSTGSRARWRFASKEATRAAISVDERIRRRPDEIAFRVRNNSSNAVTITVEASELPWHPTSENLAVNWTIGPGQPLAPGEDKTLHFAFSDAQCTGKTDRNTPIYPLFGFVVRANEIKPTVSYDLILSDLTVHYPQAPRIQVTELDCPASVTAGKATTFRVSANGSVAGRVLDLELRRGQSILWRIRLTPKEIAELAKGACDIARTVPWHIASGSYTIGLVADGYRVAGPEASIKVTNSTASVLPHAERRLYNGRPTFFLNGKPRVWQGYASYDYQPGSVAQFGASGTNVFCVPACAGKHIHGVCSPTMIAPGRFDYGSLDERVSFSLQSNPDALIMLRVSLALPRFWSDEHPNDLARVRTDIGDLAWEETGTQAASIASDVWRRDQAEALRHLIRYCKAQPWSSRLAGVLLTGEVTEEWFAWGCNDGFYSDYSANNQKRFGEWLTKRGSAAQPIPAPSVRKHPGSDLYPDDANGRLASAYHQYASELTADAIGYFADVVKRETDNRCLVGSFYGYVIQLAGEPRQAIAGHSALRRVIDDPNIDFIAGIPLLDFRNLTDGYNPYTSATESIYAAGKLFCNENDILSWLHPIIWHTDFDPADPRAAAISMHRRECANDAVHGVVSQKFSLMASWHSDAKLHADFARQQQVNSRALAYDRTPVEQIGFVVDESAFDWTPPESTLLNAAHKQLLKCLGRTGAPVSVWLLSDIERMPERIKFVVYAATATSEPWGTAGLGGVLSRTGRSVLVVGPAGLVDCRSGKRRPQFAAQSLGLPIRIDDRQLPGKMVLCADNSPIESAGSLRPRAYVEGEGTLRYEDGTTAGAELELANGGRLIWCGAPPLSTDLLRRWVERAGVHCYAPVGYFVHASRELVSITSPTAAEVVLHWPEKCSTVDLFDGWRGSGVDIPCPFAAGQTRLFARRA